MGAAPIIPQAAACAEAHAVLRLSSIVWLARLPASVCAWVGDAGAIGPNPSALARNIVGADPDPGLSDTRSV